MGARSILSNSLNQGLIALACLLAPGNAFSTARCPSDTTTGTTTSDGQRCGPSNVTLPASATQGPPPGSGDAAKSAATSVSTMTGTTDDSQNNLQATHQNMTKNGSGGSREVGTMDVLEAILLLPLNPGRAAKLLVSGQQAHDASNKLDAVAAKAQQNAELMKATPTTGAARSAPGAGGAGGVAGGAAAEAPSGSGASNPMNSERAGELFGQLDSKYGMGRDDFVNGVNSVKADPEGVGIFMQEATGDQKVGKDAVNAALDAYAEDLGVNRSELYAAATKASPPAEAAPSAPTSAAHPSAPTLAPLTSSEATGRQLASAKEAKETKESLRDKLRKAMAERQSGSSGAQEPLSGDTLLPIKDQFFESIKAQNEKELTLFDVVRSKYEEKWPLMLRRPTP